MDQETGQDVNLEERFEATESRPAGATSRRRFLKYGLGGLACLGAGGAAAYYAIQRGGPALEAMTQALTASKVFRNDAPKGELWERWKARGWVKEARHYLKLGANVQCKLCPNDCLLEPEDRSCCRNKVNKDGTLYTLAYGNACSLNVDPIEKKPLFHFMPGTDVFSFATSGCGFRCLNCQNWDISQRKPEESKDPRGESVRLNPQQLPMLTQQDVDRASIFPEDVVALAEYLNSPSIAYTYSEPTSWYEYMIDTAQLARAKGVKNVWVTCGYIEEEPLVELCGFLDAANVDLKSFDAEIYEKLNSGKLEPILRTLEVLKREGVWFEVTNLLVPTYTDKQEMIRRMCDWMVEKLGPDVPLHFSRFHPAHKLSNLPPTPVEVLKEARSTAWKAGLHHVYIGNVRDVNGAETTFCPNCGEKVIQRQMYSVNPLNFKDGRCTICDCQIAGAWS